MSAKKAASKQVAKKLAKKAPTKRATKKAAEDAAAARKAASKQKSMRRAELTRHLRKVTIDDSITELDFSGRPRGVLERNKVHTVGDFLVFVDRHGEKGLRNFRNLGQTSVDEIMDRYARVRMAGIGNGKPAKTVAAATKTATRPTTTKKVTAKAAAKTAKKATKASANGSTTKVTRPPTYDGGKTELRKPPSTTHTMPQGQIVISRIGTETIRVPILGLNPLITHKFSEKAKRHMLDSMQNRRQPKEPKNPEEEFKAAAYRFDDGGYGIPAIAFKSCTVSAARLFGKSVTMASLRQFIFVRGEFSLGEGQMLARINGDMSQFELTPEMREDVVRVSSGGTDLRYRPCWINWESWLDITYVKNAITQDSVLSLVEAGGLTVGVGEWRPEKKGEYGTFCIHPDRQIEELSK